MFQKGVGRKGHFEGFAFVTIPFFPFLSFLSFFISFHFISFLFFSFWSSAVSLEMKRSVDMADKAEVQMQTSRSTYEEATKTDVEAAKRRWASKRGVEARLKKRG